MNISGLERKTMAFRVEAVDGKAVGHRVLYTGIASTPLLDTYDDIVRPYAFDKTIEKRFKTAIATYGTPDIKIYREHVQGPVAVLKDIQKTPEGLKIAWQFLTNTKGTEAKIEVDEGAVNKLSIGYRTIKSNNGMVDGKNVRYLEEVELFEISLVDDPANIECAVDRPIFETNLLPKASTQDVETKVDIVNREGDMNKEMLLKMNKMCGELHKMCKMACMGAGCTDADMCDDEPSPPVELETSSSGVISSSTEVVPAAKSKATESLQKTIPDPTTDINGQILESLQDMTNWVKTTLTGLEVKNGG